MAHVRLEGSPVSLKEGEMHIGCGWWDALVASLTKSAFYANGFGLCSLRFIEYLGDLSSQCPNSVFIHIYSFIVSYLQIRYKFI